MNMFNAFKENLIVQCGPFQTKAAILIQCKRHNTAKKKGNEAL